MPLYLALSCLQGQPAAASFDALVALGADGIQLTPGNVEFADFRDHVEKSGVPHSFHHSFDWIRTRRLPWNASGTVCMCLEGASVHPPVNNAQDGWLRHWIANTGGRRVLETMYPSADSYPLASEAELDEAMERGVHLAVDVSHLWIQRCAGALSDEGFERIKKYEHVEEIHVSANMGRHDTHQMMSESTFGLGWAREKMQDGMIVVAECFMHRLSQEERVAQVALVRGLGNKG